MEGIKDTEYFYFGIVVLWKEEGIEEYALYNIGLVEYWEGYLLEYFLDFRR